MYAWTHIPSGFVKTGDLELSWEVNGSSMSDDYSGAGEISAVDLLPKWTAKYFPDKKALHENVVPIYWSIRGDAMEAAPFTPAEWRFTDENFLSFFTWPTDVDNGERVNFNRLHVQDRVWNTERWDSGGFIQEATGWKPSPFEPVMYVPSVYAPANSPVMRGFENQVRRALNAGQTVEYSAVPVYRSSELLPVAVTLRAQGSGGLDFFVSILNQGK